MMTHLFWLSNEAWAAIDPHLPRGKPGKPRVDDRRVISGILHVLKTDAVGATCRPNTVRRPRSTIATIDGRSAGFGSACSSRLPLLAMFLTNSASTVRMSKRTARQPAQKGAVGASGRALARGSHLENPLSGR